MSDLTGLLERVKKASGRDRELDGLIAKACGELPDAARWMTENVYGEQADQWVSGGYGAYTFHEPPEVTSSIDAALALVERKLPGANTNGLEGDGHGGWDAYVSRNHVASGHWYFEASHKSAPLAILSALLRALIAGASE